VLEREQGNHLSEFGWGEEVPRQRTTHLYVHESYDVQTSQVPTRGTLSHTEACGHMVIVVRTGAMR
jgi:hypothetical protein